MSNAKNILKELVLEVLKEDYGMDLDDEDEKTKFANSIHPVQEKCKTKQKK